MAERSRTETFAQVIPRTRWIAIAALVAGLATGCGYLGSARPLEDSEFDSDPGWVAVRNIPFQQQQDDKDCGAACVAMVLTHWGQASAVEDVAKACPSTPDGMRAGDLRDLVKKRGLKGFLVHGTFEDLKNELTARRPVIVGLVKPYVNGGLTHYEVVTGIHPEQKRVATLDPAKGLRQNTFEGFLQEWEPAGKLTIVVIGNEQPSPGSRLPSSSLQAPNFRLYQDSLPPLMAVPDPEPPSGSRHPPIFRRRPPGGGQNVVQKPEGFREVFRG